MHWVWISLGVALFIGYILIALHAFEHSGYGCAWLAFFIFMPVIGPLIYLFIINYVNRADQVVQRQPGDSAGQQTFSRFPTEIEKARFIEAADRKFGTMYEPGTTAGGVGYPHFRDDRAELLLNEGRFDEAWSYLVDLYAVAKADGDGHREDTYLHYISRLPDGTAKLAKWRRDRRLEIGGGPGDDESPPPAAPSSSRDVPF